MATPGRARHGLATERRRQTRAAVPVCSATYSSSRRRAASSSARCQPRSWAAGRGRARSAWRWTRVRWRPARRRCRRRRRARAAGPSPCRRSAATPRRRGCAPSRVHRLDLHTGAAQALGPHSANDLHPLGAGVALDPVVAAAAVLDVVGVVGVQRRRACRPNSSAPPTRARPAAGRAGGGSSGAARARARPATPWPCRLSSRRLVIVPALWTGRAGRRRARPGRHQARTASRSET